ncbi:MAG TPA: DNA-deoxyinosine glycosylase [Herminiimonas sp.]|jgi:hypoxanthine-DNA glycosylase|nr:DNA-deoxyinosine glycosylase [Herminiimonas sp.]
MPSSSKPALLTCFPPVIDVQTSVLILGSFPGEASLSAQQYYAHPRNQFWRLVSALIGEELVTVHYDEKLIRLKAHRIGLWDVIAACEREGSLDSAIRQAQANDFNALKHRCPELRRIAFNGKTSGRHAPLFADAGFETIVLPSSSPAHASMTFEQKLAVWRGIMR